MILYHGSNTDIRTINLALCRPFKDFGRGFYLTVIKEQAENMAKRVAGIYGGSPVINVYDIVIGPIADDDMALLFRQYENGMITFDMMLNGMIYKKTTNQYSFHTEKAISLLKKVKNDG